MFLEQNIDREVELRGEIIVGIKEVLTGKCFNEGCVERCDDV